MFTFVSIYTTWTCIVLCALARSKVRSQTQDMPLDVQKFEELGEADDLLKSLKDIAQRSHNCGVKEIPKLRRHFLRNESVTCNDGTPAGYYLRKSHGSKKWLVFLAGGWYCFDIPSCRLRWESNMKNYMSSRDWPEQRDGSGLLSSDPRKNPYYFNANIVFVPYCSSDSWSGTSANSDGYAFLGALIVEEVIKDLIPEGLQKARKLFLTGSSAGATGVMINLDHVADMLRVLAPRVEVRGIADSGWFVDMPQYRSTECKEPFSCAPADGIRRGFAMWKGRVPEECAKQYPGTEQWNCFFGYKAYPTLRTPLYVVQYLFDEAQITVNNLIDHSQVVSSRGRATLFSPEQWEYLYHLGERVKDTLQNVSAVFAPACLSHELLLRSTWQTVSINGVNLAQSIYCWENRFGRERCLAATTRNNSIKPKPSTPLLGDEPTSNVSSNSSRKKRKRNNKKRKNLRRRRKKKRRRERERRRRNRMKRNKRRKRNKKNKKGKTNRAQRSAASTRNCGHHVIELCPLPQWCNSYCPAFINRMTGEEINFFELFARSGIDRGSISDMLSMEESRINSMNISRISQLLLDTFRNQTT